MSRIAPVDPAAAEGKVRELLAAIQQALGVIPNLYRVIARSPDPKEEAALRFVRRVVERRGCVDDADLAEVRGAGFDDGQVVELVASTALNVFTNYLNHVADTEIDFPVVRANVAKAA